jgi:hypothetical protein
MSGRHAWAMVFLALAFADMGRTESADAVYVELQGRSLYQYVAPTALAMVAAAASREHDVSRHARQALEIRDPGAFMFSRHILPFGRPYEYQEFREIIALMGRDDWLRD